MCTTFRRDPEGDQKSGSVWRIGQFFTEFDAISKGADAFVSADFKYHQFFDADGQLLIADVGHYESEQFTMELLKDIILQKKCYICRPFN